MKTAVKEITLRSKGTHHYTGKKVLVNRSTNFVSFVGLVKAICKTDHEQINSNRFWGRLKDDVRDNEYQLIDDTLFVSASVIEKLTNNNAVRCEKTWGYFQKDGLHDLLEDLGGSGGSKRISDAQTPSSFPSSSKKRLVSSVDVTFENREEVIITQRKLLKLREKNMNEREELLNKRSSLLCLRENEIDAKEELLDKKLVELYQKEKRLQKLSVPELSDFMKKVSSLANAFKEKVTRSQRNSSEEVARSLTPSVSGGKDTSVQDFGNHSQTPPRSPSPIPLSDRSSPEVRTCVTVHIHVRSF